MALGNGVCTFNHVVGKVCYNYLIGFCPEGPECKLAHLKSCIADLETTLSTLANFPPEENWVDKNSMPTHMGKPAQKIRCHNCGQPGHKSTYC